MRFAAAALLALALAGCGSGKTPDATTTPKGVSDYFNISLGGHVVRLQFAVLEPEQARGLMERPDLGKDDGMIFVDPAPKRESFWMHDTPEALDIAFLGNDGVIAEIYPLYPFDERTVTSHSEQLQFAIEMRQGWFAANAVRPGASIDLKAVADALRARGFDPLKFKLQ